MKRLNLIAVLLCCALFALAQQSKLSPYSRVLVDAQNEAKTTEQRTQLRKNFHLRVANNGQDVVSAFVHFADAAADKSGVLAAYGATLVNDFDDFVTARIPVENLEALSQDEAVKMVEVGTPARRRMDKARTAANVDKVQAGTDLTQPFLGTDVVVGVVDGGFQYDHITFYDLENTSELRVKCVYNLETDEKYETQSDIEKAGYDDEDDTDGHATHVTGIAAGSYSGNNYYGVAKDADIVMVRYGNSEDNTDIINGIKYVFDYATKVGKPAVVNLSLGTHIGPHDGTSTFDVALDKIVGEGRIVCGAAGNEGDYPLYSEATLAAGESHTFVLDVTDYYDGSQAFADFWGDEGQQFTVQIVYMNSSGTVQKEGTATSTATSSEQSTKWSNSTYASGSLAAYTQLSTYSSNNKGNVYVQFNNFKPRSNYKIGFKVTAKTAGTVRVWGDDYSSIYWENGSTSHTVGEIGGTAKGIITVGAYTTNKHGSDDLTVGDLAYFSSLGPTADGRMKPEITAPGSYIVSSVPNTTAVTSDDYFDKATSKKVNGTTYYWAYMQGTSMATPFVTGVVATWLQADPTLTPDELREIFSATAMSDSYTGTSLPNNTWGYGKIDAHAGLLEVIKRLGGEAGSRKDYVVVGKRSTGNYFYMSSNLGQGEEKHLTAVDAGTDDLSQIVTSDLPDSIVWSCALGGVTTHLYNGSQAVTWTSGNTADLDATGLALNFNYNSDKSYTFSFADAVSTTHTLALDATEGNDYFAFYESGNITTLFLLPVTTSGGDSGDDDDDTPDVSGDCNALPFSESFENFSQGEFTTYDAIEISNYKQSWQATESYGMKIGGQVNKKNLAAEGWLISPCIDLTKTIKPILTFDHTHKYAGTPEDELTLWISADYSDGDPSTATWEQLTIPNYGTNEDWTFVSSGDINLSKYNGKTVRLAWKYTSSSKAAAIWELKNVSIEETGSTATNLVPEREKTIVVGLQGALAVFGAQAGDQIEVYTVSGVRYMARAAQGDFTMLNLPQGIYLVKVNDSVHKVVVE